jgi:hypothetical protein
VDDALVGFLAAERAPLVLAGVESHFPIYREASRYGHLLPEGIAGNPELLSTAELHERGWSLVEPVFRRAQEAALAQYRQFAGTGNTSSQLAEILVAAGEGRVGTLFVARDAHRWGTPPTDGQALSLHDEREPGDTDLLDVAAAETLRRHGIVHVLGRERMPDGLEAAALLRKG